MESLLDFFLNQSVGRVLVRLVGSAAIGLASGKWGVKLELSPEQQAQLVTSAVGGFNALISWLKPRLPKLAPHLDPIVASVPGEPMKPFDYKP